MADESPAAAITDKHSHPDPATAPLSYRGLRWVIRFTGVLLMFGGAIYFGTVACTLVFGKLVYHQATEGLYVLVVSLLALGLGYFIFRVGLNMLRSINAATISSFSFLFALVYTPVFMRILPALGLVHRQPVLTIFFVLGYFGLTYLILKRILLLLLLPKE